MEYIQIQPSLYIVDVLPHVYHKEFIEDDRILDPTIINCFPLLLWDIRKKRHAMLPNVNFYSPRTRISLLTEINQLHVAIHSDCNTNYNTSTRNAGILKEERVLPETQKPTDSLVVIQVPACIRCAPEKLLLSGTKIKKGMHLRFGKYFPHSDLNQYMKVHFRNKLNFFYYHHAIVTDIFDKHERYAEAELIEFGGKPLKATKTRRKIDLTSEHVEYICYKFHRYSVDDIVRRAHECLTQVFDQNYNVFYNNCEHLARWCVSGEHISNQVDEMVENAIDHLKKTVNQLLIYLSKAPNLDSDLIKMLACTVFIIISASEVVYSHLREHQFERDLKNGFFCTRCRLNTNERVANRGWLAASAYVLLVSCKGYNTIRLITKCSLLFCLMFAGYSILQQKGIYVRSEQTPFFDRYVSKIRITRKHQLPIGSILAHPNYSQVIVKNVIYKSDSSDYSQMQIVHYPYRGILGKRVVSEETFSFNLAVDWLQILEFPEDIAYDTEEVVSNAHRKLGEKKFNMFTNRSSHMAWSCKVRNTDNQNRQPERKYVKRNDDVKVGDLVNFRYYGLPHQGILTRKNEKAEILKIEFIYINKQGLVVESSDDIDMGKTNISVCNYFNLNIHTNAQILENAQSKVGQLLTRVQFLKECLLKYASDPAYFHSV